jgi:hypothetical protein
VKRLIEIIFKSVLWENLRRVRTEIIFVILIIIFALVTLSAEARQGLSALMITKPLFATLGVLYAHVSRKFLFPYLNFKDLIDQNKGASIIFMSVWYGVIIYCFALGG